VEQPSHDINHYLLRDLVLKLRASDQPEVMEVNLGVGVLAIKETNQQQFMGIVETVLVGKLLITIYEVGIRLFIGEYVFMLQVDERSDLFDVLVIQFHLVSVPFDGSSVFLEAD
jgi:hypothetical protein